MIRSSQLDLNRLPAVDLARRIAAREITSEALVRACLARISEREDAVQAWAHIDPDAVLREARARDAEDPRGPLHGIPVGVKDIIATAAFPTEYGSPIYRGFRPGYDAACVALAVRSGAIVMGKTATTEFALRHPAATRNPHDLSRTPGGSSSGSAAAVADCMVPLAFGTQTGGSQIRPASFCGVVGYKPSLNAINVSGVKPLSPSNDTVGAHGRTVRDVALFVCAISGMPMPVFDDDAEPRIGFCRTPQWRHAEPAMMSAMETAASRLSKRGYRVSELSLPPPFDELLEAQEAVYKFELARTLAYERDRFPEMLSPVLRNMLQAADRFSWTDYRKAWELVGRCRALLVEVFGGYDVLLVPSAAGEAPLLEQGTGDAVFNKNWTILGVPAVSIPVFTGPSNMPMGAQVIGPFHEDGRTLVYADRLMRELTRAS
jgi:Asp-tRNA(Asn)/Glu-tRNA(Gln) amidotransferase A subunit family amidase